MLHHPTNETASALASTRSVDAERLAPSVTAPFEHAFNELFASEFSRVFRVLQRISGDHDLASDLAQDAFVKLFRRGAMPEHPRPWLVTVGLNLFRNVRASDSRRRHLLTVERGGQVHADQPPSPEAAAESDDARRNVRAVLQALSERDRMLLLMRAEGYSYREMAMALDLNEASVGTLLARAIRAFKRDYNA